MTRKGTLLAVIGGAVGVWLLITLYSMNQKIESMDRTLSIIESTVGRSSEQLNENYYLLNDIESRLRGE